MLLCFLFVAAAGAGLAALPAAAQSEDLQVVFDFAPSKTSYVPGENFTVEFSVVNAVPTNPDFPTVVKVTRISSYFSWMGPGEWSSEDVAGSTWLNSSELQSYSMTLTVPQNSSDRVYSYMFKVDYEKEVLNSGWGSIPASWESVVSHDFTVAKVTSSAPPSSFTYVVVAIALVLAAAAIVVALYFSYFKGLMTTGLGATPPPPATPPAPAATVNLEEPSPAPAQLYPVIRASPGEQFPIEKGFVYLVKEKRPSIAFQMYNEATAHGAVGMLVVREHPNRLKQLHEFEAAKILWLTRRVGLDHIDPTELSLLSLEVSKFVEARPKSIVLIEGLEYIITQNDFETVLRFVNHLHDFVLAHDCAVVFVIDPRVLSTRELALLERSARIVEPIERNDVRFDKPEEVPT